MQSWWLKFTGRPAGCVEAPTEAEAVAIALAETGHTPSGAQRLPYPATPRINQYQHPKHGACPAFCYKPEECAGRTSCPQRYSCTE